MPAPIPTDAMEADVDQINREIEDLQKATMAGNKN